MNAVETKNLTKKYGDKTAVDAIGFSVAEGELFALLGVNGAGKTTTIRMLCCLSKPDSGEALVYGKNTAADPNGVKRLVGISTQDTAVAPNLTVRENLEFAAGIYGLPKERIKEKVAEIVAAFHLEEVEKSRAKTLSGGWQRKVSIAMALISAPRVLFLDEPTLGLDVLARRELWRVIGELKGKITIVLTTHYMEEAEALSDRIGIMAGGRLIACGTLAELEQSSGEAGLENAFIKIVEKSGIKGGE
ncbi:MAG: ABC transporter ATP-binding protein [Bacteroides sp.]|nr:ABC transporter ATP-binding protein [Eubacterium sp.]MCM1417777.1 ABC transporter ATP-binding protein [Roseburia sp.]MCM1461332.1 ABC transporter ATP-binding protein [Bacteroides sp.]